MTNLITPRALFSLVFLQSCSVIHESGSDISFQRYGHSKFSKTAASRHLGFRETGNSAIRSAVPENPTVGSNVKYIGWPVAEIWPFEVLQNARSVGRWSVGRRSTSIYTLFSCTPLRYVAKRCKTDSRRKMKRSVKTSTRYSLSCDHKYQRCTQTGGWGPNQWC